MLQGSSALLTLLSALVLWPCSFHASPSPPALRIRSHTLPTVHHGLVQAQPVYISHHAVQAEDLSPPLITVEADVVTAKPEVVSESEPTHMLSTESASINVSESTAVVEVSEKEDKDIREIKHYKHPGAGYKKGSPMYPKQQAKLATTSVSIAMKCCILLTAQFFIVYAALFTTQTLNKNPSVKTRIERCLICVAKTQYFIPMLCILFFSVRMRSVQLAQGQTNYYDLPPWWVKQAMLACTICVMIQTVVAAVYYALLSKDPDGVRSSNPSRIEKILNFTRWLIIVILYLNFMIVCIGVCTMKAPAEIWGVGRGPEVSPAVFCTMFLTTLYFAVHFCIEVVKNIDEFSKPEGKRFGAFEQQNLLVRDAADEVDVAPMLCLLFLASRLRALQLDPKLGHPPSWAQTFFYISSFSVVGLVLLCVMAAYLLQKEGINSVGQDSQTTLSARPSGKLRIVETLRSVLMIFLYLSALAIIFSIYAQKQRNGPTPDMPPAIKCVIVLAIAYFVVFSILWFTRLAMKLKRSPSVVLTNLSNFFEKQEVSGRRAIDFAPMLGVLFLGLLLRALQLTGGTGAPQPWGQTFMYSATMACLLMIVARVDLLFCPPAPDTKPEGPQISAPLSTKGSKFCAILQYLCMLVMYTSVLFVIVALFTMTPQTADGTGAVIHLAASTPIM